MQATTHWDIFSPKAIDNPYDALDEIRELGPAVYVEPYEFWLLTRYNDVKAATENWQTFSSHGVALNPQANAALVGSPLQADPPEHEAIRSVLSEKLAPRALRSVRDYVDHIAEDIVSGLVEKGDLNVVRDLSRIYPITVVSDLVGLPREGRELLHPGADATIAAFGPFTPYVQEHFPAFIAYDTWIRDMFARDRLSPDGWGAAILNGVDAGIIPEEWGNRILGAYMTAGMDTTVNAISSMVHLFATRQDIWETLKAHPSLSAPFFEELLRLETPVLGFWRLATEDTRIGDVEIPQGRQIMVHWGAANRDPRKYDHPKTFDIQRNALDHLGFGFGIHGCVGQGLARLEVSLLIQKFLERVERFELVGDVQRRANPIVRSLESVPVRIHAAAAP